MYEQVGSEDGESDLQRSRAASLSTDQFEEWWCEEKQEHRMFLKVSFCVHLIASFPIFI